MYKRKQQQQKPEKAISNKQHATYVYKSHNRRLNKIVKKYKIIQGYP